jgi:uncharacterized membrane protein
MAGWRAVEIVREISIARPVEEVFAFVADARNDQRWCPKVRSVTTRMRQASRATLGAPRLLGPLYRAGIGRDIARQLKALKGLREGDERPR